MLAEKLKGLADSLDGTAGVMIKNMESGETISFNEDITFPAASIIKLWILWDLFKNIKNGKLSLDNEVILEEENKVGGFGILKELHSGLKLTVRDLASLMIILSDNTATNMLIDKLGMENINGSIKEIGATKTVLQRRMMDYEVIKKGIDNFTSPSDVLNIFERFFKSVDLPHDQAEIIIEILKRQQCNNKLPALLPEEAVLAHKTGDMPGIEHDAGVLYTNKGPVIVVVMTKELGTNQEGVDFNKAVGKALYDYYF